ncbi:MAG: acyl-CoA dehydrogenase [Massilia sp.]|jgi:alkylation response protein AidB-like acyl-CoA dehydrogenase|nr:acyl-CoA dehydrogenase [Massilia sp.]
MSILTPFDAARIGRDAAHADRGGWLSARQQALLHRRGWLRMLAPRAAGGLELDLPSAVRLEEAVAAVDGSMAWVLTLCAGAGWFAGFMAPAVAREIVATRRLCVAGSGAPSGFADIEEAAGDDGGLDIDLDLATARFTISGRWDYASGAPMATHFTLNAVLRRSGRVLVDSAGKPRIRAFIVPARLVTLEPSWRTIGLRASASHSYRVDCAAVDGGNGFAIDPERATAAGPLYRFPFMSLAFVTLSVNLAGMASHFLALAAPAIGKRRQSGSGLPLSELPGVRARLEQANAALAGARGEFYAALDGAWARLAGGADLRESDCALLQARSLALVEAARMAVDGIYPYCGLAAASADTALNRVWRDFHTATQHTLLLP